MNLGPEIITGSTRLKSGTAQKLVLNMLSTVSMIGIGKTYQNLMVDVKSSNEKLVERSKRMIMEATGCEYDIATQNYEECGRQDKLAIVKVLLNCSVEEAKERLEMTNGFVKKAIEK